MSRRVKKIKIGNTDLKLLHETIRGEKVFIDDAGSSWAWGIWGTNNQFTPKKCSTDFVHHQSQQHLNKYIQARRIECKKPIKDPLQISVFEGIAGPVYKAKA